MVVQQLRSLQPERQILPESPSQAPAPEEAGNLLEELEGPLLPPEEQRDADRPRFSPKQVMRWRGDQGKQTKTKRKGGGEGSRFPTILSSPFCPVVSL